MKKKILFVITVNPYDAKKYSFPPISLGYLVSSLKQYFGKDCFKFKIIDKDFYREIDNFLPDIVCISSVSQNYNIAKKYAKYAKRKNAFVIVGGIHISTLPSSLSEYMDVGVIGEGEETIIELIEAISPQSTVSGLKNIKGIIYRENGNIIQTEKRPFLDVNKIPHPDRSLIDDKNNCLIFSSRGCPYNCFYCSYPVMWGRERLFPAEHIVEEIGEIFSRKINFATFVDYLLAIDKNRLREIITLLKEKKNLGKIHFSTSAYSNLIDEEIGEMFKEMNIVSCSMSLLSGSDKILKTIKGNSYSLSATENALSVLKKNNISVYASFVIGLPNETKGDIKDTLKFIKSHSLNFFDIYLPAPYPATQLWKWAEEKWLVNENMDWDKLNTDFYHYGKRAVIISSHLTREELHREFYKFAKLKFIFKIKNIIFLLFKYIRKKIF